MADRHDTHQDRLIPRGTILYTLSYNLTRTHDTDMFYAVYKREDLGKYLTMLNGSLIDPLVKGPSSNVPGTKAALKYEITNLTCRDILMASENSAAKVFAELFDADGDFRDFVTRPTRMQSHFRQSRYLYQGYRDARAALRRIRSPRGAVAYEDLATAYRMFNYVLPSDGKGDVERAQDIVIQRRKFFEALKTAGYGATLDTNDALYGAFKASSPIIVFDVDGVVPQEARETREQDKNALELIAAATRLLSRRKRHR